LVHQRADGRCVRLPRIAKRRHGPARYYLSAQESSRLLLGDERSARQDLTTTPHAMLTLTTKDFEQARARIEKHIKRTPLFTSRQLSEATGYDMRLKAELFQR